MTATPNNRLSGPETAALNAMCSGDKPASTVAGACSLGEREARELVNRALDRIRRLDLQEVARLAEEHRIPLAELLGLWKTGRLFVHRDRQQPQPARPTRRQLRILRGLRAGKSRFHLAAELGISPASVTAIYHRRVVRMSAR